MKICGLNKTTLLDYPGKVAATVFFGGCNLRCPFCQNGGLVLHPELEPEISRRELLHFLEKRKKILDGVCITGGEPTLDGHLEEFLNEIKGLGYLVKLDTNGTRPQVVERLLAGQLVDYVAMDIKSSRENYREIAGKEELDLEAIEESVDLIREKAPEYEFRTTVVRELHSRADFEQIAGWLCGAKAYYLQAYRDSDQIIQPGFSSYAREQMEEFAEILRSKISFVGIRGMD